MRKRRVISKLSIMSGTSKRNKSNVWDEFDSNEDSVHCKHCDYTISSRNIERLMNHIMHNCRHLPVDTKLYVAALYNEKYVTSCHDVDESIPSQALKLTTQKSQRDTRTFATPVVTTEQKRSFQEYLTLALITGNIPWRFLENEYLWQALRVLHPSVPKLTDKLRDRRSIRWCKCLKKF